MIPKNTSIIVRRVPITQRIHPMAPVSIPTIIICILLIEYFITGKYRYS